MPPEQYPSRQIRRSNLDNSISYIIYLAALLIFGLLVGFSVNQNPTILLASRSGNDIALQQEVSKVHLERTDAKLVESNQVESKQEVDEVTEVGSNLITNGSMQSMSEEGPEGWIQSTWSGNAVFEVEEVFAHSGDRCLKIHSDDAADASWSFRVAVKPSTEYRLSAWVKTENIDSDGYGALLNLHELQKEGKAEALRGTNDWTQVVTEFSSGAHESLLVNLLFGGWGQATGTAWFDDVRLVELKRPAVPAEPTLNEADALALFDAKVLPVLKDKCFSCHGGGDKIRGKLVLTNRDDMLKGGESGEAIDLKFPMDSLLLEAINYDGYEMPPEGKLPADEIKAITQWVAAGAPWKGEGFKPDTDHDVSSVPQVNDETKKWWSYQPVKRPDVPAMNATDEFGGSWPANEIDNFIFDRLKQNELKPAVQTDRRTLIRRATYDLIGLPPSSQEVAEFVADDSPDAYEKLIDRLLASPNYGEKWGRHWLDVVRYAESNSYERDGTKPFVWRYRDYVIRSFNDDKPYDLFLMEQLAGDEMDEVTPERIIATGYYRLGLWDDEPANPKQAWFDDVDDILATTSQGMLGMTLNCARCHDHKIDPIPQKDYYRMLAFFRNFKRYGVRSHQSVEAASVRVIGSKEAKITHAAELKEWNEALETNKKAMEEIEQQAMKDFTPVEHEEFRSDMNHIRLITKREGSSITKRQAMYYRSLFDERRSLRNNRPAALEAALCIKETGSDPIDTHIMIRGNAEVPGEKVEPGFPSVLSPPSPEIQIPADGKSTGRRMALAQWISDPTNPLTARVMVNRLWQHHFGRGLVRGSSDFGFQGTPPTHPLLLDWLASEFVERDWSIKSMHKLIMMSAAYRMSSDMRQAAYDADPVNDLFWRFNMRRLTAEEIRDSILATNGNLNRDKMYGPSIYPIIPDEVLQGQSIPGDNWGESSKEDLFRRSVYIHVKRSLPVPMLASFDAADADTPCPVRFNTVQPTQALGMINSDFLKRQSTDFANFVAGKQALDMAGQVTLVLQLVTQRRPSETEVQRGIDFMNTVIADQSEGDDQARKNEALRQFCLLALNLNEFLYLD